jgi:hypothetical protein
MSTSSPMSLTAHAKPERSNEKAKGVRPSCRIAPFLVLLPLPEECPKASILGYITSYFSCYIWLSRALISLIVFSGDLVSTG